MGAEGHSQIVRNENKVWRKKEDYLRAGGNP
jgi:hypothetical protein